jgi:glycine C-acetyltransferase
MKSLLSANDMKRIMKNASVIDYLRETASLYIYSNPITPAEAAAALQAIQILDSTEGGALLAHLRALGKKLRTGLADLGQETILGDHPIVPIFIRDTEKTSAMVEYLFDHDILVTGLNYPVVPKGDEEIRLQVSASHTDKDIDYVLDILQRFELGGQIRPPH